MLEIPTQLFTKYDYPTPRYTSYPTVPCWEGNVTPTLWRTNLKKRFAESASTGMALYIHIPFCRSLCSYCGCTKVITPQSNMNEPYIQALLQEWQIYQKLLAPHGKLPLVELHIGGGTPTFFSAQELKSLLEPMLRTCDLGANTELSIEVDPRTTTDDHLKTLSELGFRRISLGVQDFSNTVQEAVNRVQGIDMVRKVTEKARQMGFTSINFDLIYGLPLQTPASICETVRIACELDPDRFAFYSYAHVPWLKSAQKRFSDEDIPVGEKKWELYRAGRDVLESYNYQSIGMDHFAKKDDSLYRAKIGGQLHRNFMGYTAKQTSPLIGIGMSSISDSGDMFAQNDKNLKTYLSSLRNHELPVVHGHALTQEDHILRQHILNLMTQFATNWESQTQQTPFLDQIQERLAPLAEDGLVKVSPYSCQVTPLGENFLRNICATFDARRVKLDLNKKLHSRSI